MNGFRAPIFVLLLSLFLFNPAISRAITITGSAFTKGLTNHAGITVVFTRISPGSLQVVTYTSVSGQYSVELQNGVYNVTYSRESYFDHGMEEISLLTSQTLPSVMLIPTSSRLLVPDDFTTIQTAVNSARAADTVLVSPGKYLENIKFKGKNIVVGSLYL
ncbi:MAG: hypothetical protein ACYC9O_02550, partial [Candidatus Latescibacterota bacterium]